MLYVENLDKRVSETLLPGAGVVVDGGDVR